jgi:hypothetical protein
MAPPPAALSTRSGADLAEPPTTPVTPKSEPGARKSPLLIAD